LTLSYAGVDLGHAPAALAKWIARSVPPAWVWEFPETWWNSRDTGLVGFRPPPPRRPIQVNRLWWPSGASRFAVGHFLADQGQVDSIRDVCYAVDEGTGLETYVAAPLLMNDGENEIETDLWLLPARPLQQIDTEGLYLLTLVDERYFWWFRAASISVIEGTTTWDNLYGQIANALGVPITVDEVPAAYLTPSSLLALKYEPLPTLLDAVAFSVGQRITRALDGTVRAWNVENARLQMTTNLATVGVIENTDKDAGGVFRLGDDDA
jgi:hypothetical protein